MFVVSQSLVTFIERLEVFFCVSAFTRACWVPLMSSLSLRSLSSWSLLLFEGDFLRALPVEVVLLATDRALSLLFLR